MKNKFPLIVFFGLISTIMFSQTASIVGKVKTSNANSLESINIKVKRTSISTTTNSSGEYEIKNLKAGNVNLLVSAIGFESQEITVELKENEVTTCS